MSDNRKFTIIAILMVLFVALSVFFWLITENPFISAIPFMALMVWEKYERYRLKNKNATLWGVLHAKLRRKLSSGKISTILKINFQNWQNWQVMKRMQSLNATAKTGTHGDHSNTPMQKSTPLSFVSSIKDIKLIDFMECVIKGNMTPIIIDPKDQYTQDEAQQVADAWIILLSQYYEARQDKRANTQRKVLLDAKTLELRKVVIDMLCDSLKVVYDRSIADSLQKYYPMFELSRDSYMNDMQQILSMEVPNKLQYIELQQLINKQDAGEQKQSEKVFYSYLNSYNRAFKTSFQLRNLYTDEYAYMCADLDRYTEDLQAQANKK